MANCHKRCVHAIIYGGSVIGNRKYPFYLSFVGEKACHPPHLSLFLRCLMELSAYRRLLFILLCYFSNPLFLFYLLDEQYGPQ